ncbi:MAG: hypothetical protein ACRDHL_14115 [Candidatus Promineifilaceae bacterium]
MDTEPRAARLKRSPGQLLLAVLSGGLVVAAALGAEPLGRRSSQTPIPAELDWADHGPIFAAGEPGDWDRYLFGGFTTSAVRRNGTTYLYYQGASGYREGADETVTFRAIGLATSSDGLHFVKAAANPVLTWTPTDGEEEGAASGAVTLDSRGVFWLFYGANTAYSQTQVNADGRLARSADGLDFADLGVVLSHQDETIWGSGDELFPILALYDGGRWIVYYLPNGGLRGRNLGVAWGAQPDALTHSAGVRSGLGAVSAWGAAGAAEIGPDEYAIFLNDVGRRRMEVRLMTLDAPHRLSRPVASYAFDNATQGTVLLDRPGRAWYLYYRTEGGYGVRLASLGGLELAAPPTSEALMIEAPRYE